MKRAVVVTARPSSGRLILERSRQRVESAGVAVRGPVALGVVQIGDEAPD